MIRLVTGEIPVPPLIGVLETGWEEEFGAAFLSLALCRGLQNGIIADGFLDGGGAGGGVNF